MSILLFQWYFFVMLVFQVKILLSFMYSNLKFFFKLTRKFPSTERIVFPFCSKGFVTYEK